MNINIIIPAYNEQDRIGTTLKAYSEFFQQIPQLSYQLTVVANACTDQTTHVVASKQRQYGHIGLVHLPQKGKGGAIIAGFKEALAGDADIIGFVDADMSTMPGAYYDLIQRLGDEDGAIASRYMEDSVINSPRPKVKRLGSKLTYELLAKRLLGLHYSDLQCGAKVFKRTALATVVPQLTITEWAFDIELLYVLKRSGFQIKELPTVWHDRPGSKLATFKDGIRMLGAVVTVRKRHHTTYAQ